MPIENGWYSGQPQRHRAFRDLTDMMTDTTRYSATDLGTLGVLLDTGSLCTLINVDPVVWANSVFDIDKVRDATNTVSPLLAEFDSAGPLNNRAYTIWGVVNANDQATLNRHAHFMFMFSTKRVNDAGGEDEFKIIHEFKGSAALDVGIEGEIVNAGEGGPEIFRINGINPSAFSLEWHVQAFVTISVPAEGTDLFPPPEEE